MKTFNLEKDWIDFGTAHGIAPQLLEMTMPKLKQYMQKKLLPIQLIYLEGKVIAASFGRFGVFHSPISVVSL